MPTDIIYIKSLFATLEKDLVLLKSAVKELEEKTQNRNRKHQQNRIALERAQQWYLRYHHAKSSKQNK